MSAALPNHPADLAAGIPLTGQFPADLSAFLLHHGHLKTLAHSLRVAETARDLALRFAVDPPPAQLAAWLHDCSAVIPVDRRLETCLAWKIEVLPEEAAFPLILHQKLSVILAREIFNIHDAAVLSAIGCHTTLKPGASAVDRVVFVADKLSWDQPGRPPYWESMQDGMAHSLAAGALAYLNHLFAQRSALPGPLHPWALAARLELLSAG